MDDNDRNLIRFMAIVVILFSVLSLIGHALSITAFYRWFSDPGMAVNTGFALIIVGLMFLHLMRHK